MINHSKLEHLICAAKTGDKKAQEDFFKNLTVRFSALITRELRSYPILTNYINLDEKSQEVCHHAINEVKKLCPLSNSNFSIVQAGNVLHNILDTFVTNALVELAKKGDKEAEELLFSILRKKLIERITKKRWGESQYEYEDK